MPVADRLLRVLVVGDEASVRSFAERLLPAAGYDVVTAPDGPEALGLVEHERFDLFVVDVVMPRMNGAELARRLRQLHPETKVLFFTGYCDRLFDEYATLSPHEAFLEKPTSGAGLREAVSLMLFGHLTRRQAAATVSVRYTTDADTDNLVQH